MKVFLVYQSLVSFFQLVSDSWSKDAGLCHVPLWDQRLISRSHEGNKHRFWILLYTDFCIDDDDDDDEEEDIISYESCLSNRSVKKERVVMHGSSPN